MNLREIRNYKRTALPIGARVFLKCGEELLVGDINQYSGVCDDCIEDRDVEKIVTADGEIWWEDA